MSKRLIPMAICYDFDGTLSPGNMQEYGFMDKLQTTLRKFWLKSNTFAKENCADLNLASYTQVYFEYYFRYNLVIVFQNLPEIL